jgi:predicted MFS family arabinose efflux permease
MSVRAVCRPCRDPNLRTALDLQRDGRNADADLVDSKRVVWLGIAAGSTIGGLVPDLWGAGFFSLAGFVGSIAGALIGLWAALRVIESI